MSTNQFIDLTASQVFGRSVWKPPVRLVATGSITLSGLQTIDGKTTLAGDRVLVAGNGVANGPYVASTGAWTRDQDWIDASTALLGARWLVLEGSANAGFVYAVSSPTTGAITVGSTVIAFAVAGVSAATSAATPNTLALRDGSANCAFSALSVDATPATAGSIRIGASGAIKNRNSANSANSNLISVDGADGINIGDATYSNNQTNIQLASGGVFEVLTGGALTFEVDATQIQIVPANVKWISTVAAPTLMQSTRSGTGANAGQALSISAQAGQNQTGAVANNNGGNIVLQSGAAGTGGSGAAGTPGNITFKAGATTLGTSFLNGTTDWRFALDAGLTLLLFQANGASQGITFQALGATAGQVQFQSKLIAFSDNVGPSQALSIAPNASGSTTLTSVAGTALTIQQSTQTSDVACNDTTISTQAAFATATANNRIGGNLNIVFPAATNGYTATPALLKIKEGATPYIQMGHYQVGAVYGAIWFGNITASQTNFGFLGDGVTSVYLNIPSATGQINLSFDGTSAKGINITNTLLTSQIPTWSFATGVATPKLNQADQTGASTNGQSLTIGAQNATGTTSNGGQLNLTGGTGTSVAGGINLQTGGTSRLSIQPFIVQLLSAQQQWVRNAQTTGGAVTVDFFTGNIQQITLNANITSLTLSNLKDGGLYMLVLVQDATGSRTFTKPSTLIVPGGTYTITSTANKRDILWGYSDGTNLYVQVAQNL